LIIQRMMLGLPYHQKMGRSAWLRPIKSTFAGGTLEGGTEGRGGDLGPAKLGQ
jgi:hypothetical protein